MALYDDFKDDLLPENVDQWLQEVREWEKDTSRKDLYNLTPSGELCFLSVPSSLNMS